MSEEIWKPIPFSPAYQASSHGRIIGVRGHIMKLTPNYRGYMVCDIHKRQYRVNRVICITFNGWPPTETHEAAHKDSDKSNNRADNLYWATPQQNADDLSATGKNQGVRAWRSMFTEEEIRDIRQKYSDGFRVARIADLFPQACYATISHIVHRRTYKDVL